MIPKIDWPEGKQFTLTVFDDPDGDNRGIPQVGVPICS